MQPKQSLMSVVVRMKKFLFSIIVAAGILTAQAEDYTYPYLTFVKSDGTEVSVSTSSLELTVSGNTLKAGKETFLLADLSKMFFSTTEATRVSPPAEDDDEEDLEIYDLSGRKVTREQLQKGIYLFKNKKGTRKQVVK